MIKQNQPDTEYHADKAIGSTTAKHALESWQLFNDHVSGVVVTEDKPCFQIGRIAHMMVLEPERFAKQMVKDGPINNRTKKPYGRGTDAFAKWQADNPDAIVVGPKLYTMMERMPKSIRELFTEDGEAEVSVYQKKENFSVKCRPDYLKPGTIIDLKKIRDINKIESQMKWLKYWFTSGWYRNVMALETGEYYNHEFVFCEDEAPFRWRHVILDKFDMEYGFNKAKETIKEMDYRFATNDWSDGDEVQELVTLNLDQEDYDYAL